MSSSLTASSAVLPYTHAEAVTPSDSADFTGGLCRAIYVGVSGDVAIIMEDDSAGVTLKSMPIGLYALRAKRVKSTGTTATNIIALF